MKKFKAFVVTDTYDEYWRGILRGIVHYVKIRGNWELLLSPYDFIPSASQIARWGMVGIITRPDMFPGDRWQNKIDAPIVFLDNYPKDWRREHRNNVIGKIAADEEAIARMAFQFFVNQGFENFAYVGFPDRNWSVKRKIQYCRMVRALGTKPFIFLCPQTMISKNQYRKLKDWLLALPKPIGIMACNDKFGRFVLATCYSANLKVPDEVSVLGVDNDSMLCDMSIPPLSSIVLNTEQAGYDAMSYLEKTLLEKVGQNDPAALSKESARSQIPFGNRRQVFLSSPVRIVTRASTKKEYFDDEHVNTVYGYIMNHAHDPILVDDVVKGVSISKRLLQKRFKHHTGQSISELILQVRLDNIKTYLSETDFSVKQIAQKMKFAGPSHLIHFFKKHVGKTPSEFRKDHRSGSCDGFLLVK